MVEVRRHTARPLPTVEGLRPIGLPRRTVAVHPRIVPRHRMVVVDRIEEAEHLPTMVAAVEHLRLMVVAAGRLHRAAEVAIAVEAEADVPLLVPAATVAIAN